MAAPAAAKQRHEYNAVLFSSQSLESCKEYAADNLYLTQLASARIVYTMWFDVILITVFPFILIVGQLARTMCARATAFAPTVRPPPAFTRQG
jgi:hypothetical protein